MRRYCTRPCREPRVAPRCGRVGRERALGLLLLALLSVSRLAAEEPPMSSDAFRRLVAEDPRLALQQGEALVASPFAAEHPDWHRELLFRMARAAMVLGEPGRAEAIADRLEELARQRGDAVTGGYADFARAALFADQGRVEEAVESATAGAAALTATGQGELLAVAALELCDTAANCERTDLAERHCGEALRLWKARGDLLQIGRTLNYLSGIARGAERFDEAIRIGEEARATFERAGLPGLARMMDDNLAGMRLDRGAPGDAAEALLLSRRALVVEEARGKRLHAVLSRLNEARALSMLGRPGEALASVERALAAAREIGYEAALAEIFEVRMTIAEAAGRPDLVVDSARLAVAEAYRTASVERERALAEAETRYRGLEKQREIDRLEQARALDEVKLAAAEGTVRRQRLVLVLGGAAAASLLVATGLLVLLLRSGRRRERELDRISRTDSLTGAATRRAFFGALEAAHAAHLAHGTPATLVVLDADEFKRLNDEHGHPAGDRALQSLVGRLREQVREGDLVGRLGGEEFGIVLRGLGGEEAFERAEAVRAAMASRPHALGETEIPLTVSVGVAVLDARSHASVDRWLSAADAALYEAKRAGRNRVVRAA